MKSSDMIDHNKMRKQVHRIDWNDKVVLVLDPDVADLVFSLVQRTRAGENSRSVPHMVHDLLTELREGRRGTFKWRTHNMRASNEGPEMFVDIWDWEERQ